MKKVAKRRPKKVTGTIRAKIEIPGVSVDICTNDSLNALREVRKIIDSLQANPVSSGEREMEDMTMDSSHKNIWWSISDEARSQTEFMDFVQLASKAEEQVTYKRAAIPNKSVIDMISQESYATVEITAVRKAIQDALRSVHTNDVKFAAVHVMSNVPDSEKNMICDVVGEQVKRVELKKAFTHKNILGKSVVEVLLFGKHTD